MSSKKKSSSEIVKILGRPGEDGFGILVDGNVTRLEGAELENAKKKIDKKVRKAAAKEQKKR